MRAYIKEAGYNGNIKINKFLKTVDLGDSPYLVSIGIYAIKNSQEYYENLYNTFKEQFKDERIIDLYRRGDYENIYKYIFPIFSKGPIIIGLTNKLLLISRVVFDLFMGEKTYYTRPGISIAIVSDTAKLKDDLIYPFLVTCYSPIMTNMKHLARVILQCPHYYMSDGYNILKGHIKKMYWETEYDQFIDKINSYCFNDLYILEQFLTIRSTLPIIKRAFKHLKGDDEVFFIHDTDYMYEKDVLENQMKQELLVSYTQKNHNLMLKLLDELSEFLLALFEDCIHIHNHEESYDDERIMMLVKILHLVKQENFEFQLLNEEWSFLMGIMDLYDERLSSFYKVRTLVDEQIRYHCFRLNEFLKDNTHNRRSLDVFKNRVNFQ